MPEDKAGPIAPLDAYVTAKPDEPTFTLQGGDPFGGPLARLWAHLARARVFGPKMLGDEWPNYLADVISRNLIPESAERERTNMLVRATQAECTSWDMDSYLKGYASIGAEDAKTAAENSLDEKARLDLHDTRVHAASRLNNMVFELIEIRGELFELGFFSEVDCADVQALIDRLDALSKEVEPRRLFKST